MGERVRRPVDADPSVHHRRRQTSQERETRNSSCAARGAHRYPARRAGPQAKTLITPPTAPPTFRGEFGTALAEVLSRHVEVAEIDDERDFYRTFTQEIRHARPSLWLWALLAAKRVSSLLPQLRTAADRGVRISVFAAPPCWDAATGRGSSIAPGRAGRGRELRRPPGPGGTRCLVEDGDDAGSPGARAGRAGQEASSWTTAKPGCPSDQVVWRRSGPGELEPPRRCPQVVEHP